LMPLLPGMFLRLRAVGAERNHFFTDLGDSCTDLHGEPYRRLGMPGLAGVVVRSILWRFARLFRRTSREKEPREALEKTRVIR
jgi:hypothetical protein